MIIQAWALVLLTIISALIGGSIAWLMCAYLQQANRVGRVIAALDHWFKRGQLREIRLDPENRVLVRTPEQEFAVLPTDNDQPLTPAHFTCFSQEDLGLAVRHLMKADRYGHTIVLYRDRDRDKTAEGT